MSAHQLLMACLGDGAVASDVVVVAREPEAVDVVADQLHHAIALVATGGGAVHYDQIDIPHIYIQLVTPSAVASADSTLMVV